MADTHNKETILPEFHKTVDVTNIKEFTLKQLQALDKVLDGKATEKDYETLKEMTLRDLGDLLKWELL